MNRPPMVCWGLRPIVQHLVRTNLDEILLKSRLHCHAHNVHSVVLLEAPEKTIRMFFAAPSHDLYLNFKENITGGMAVGFHPHHCDITLVGLVGRITNWVVGRGGKEFEAIRHRYDSKLKGGSGGFVVDGIDVLGTLKETNLCWGDSLQMRAPDLHTIAVQQGEPAAWLVLESKEDPNYQPLCFSTVDLEGFDSSDLYKPMTEVDLRLILKHSGLL